MRNNCGYKKHLQDADIFHIIDVSITIFVSADIQYSMFSIHLTNHWFCEFAPYGEYKLSAMSYRACQK